MTTAEHMLARVAADRGVVVLRWEISPSAIRGSPVRAIAAMNGQAERITRAVLEWRVEGDRAAARLVLEVGEDDVVAEVASARGAWVEDGEFAHGEFGELLRVSLRAGAVVWARTEILNSVLGLSGGVYEGPSAE